MMNLTFFKNKLSAGAFGRLLGALVGCFVFALWVPVPTVAWAGGEISIRGRSACLGVRGTKRLRELLRERGFQVQEGAQVEGVIRIVLQPRCKILFLQNHRQKSLVLKKQLEPDVSARTVSMFLELFLEKQDEPNPFPFKASPAVLRKDAPIQSVRSVGLGQRSSSRRSPPPGKKVVVSKKGTRPVLDGAGTREPGKRGTLVRRVRVSAKRRVKINVEKRDVQATRALVSLKKTSGVKRTLSPKESARGSVVPARKVMSVRRVVEAVVRVKSPTPLPVPARRVGVETVPLLRKKVTAPTTPRPVSPEVRLSTLPVKPVVRSVPRPVVRSVPRPVKRVGALVLRERPVVRRKSGRRVAQVGVGIDREVPVERSWWLGLGVAGSFGLQGGDGLPLGGELSLGLGTGRWFFSVRGGVQQQLSLDGVESVSVVPSVIASWAILPGDLRWRLLAGVGFEGIWATATQKTLFRGRWAGILGTRLEWSLSPRWVISLEAKYLQFFNRQVFTLQGQTIFETGYWQLSGLLGIRFII